MARQRKENEGFCGFKLYTRTAFDRDMFEGFIILFNNALSVLEPTTFFSWMKVLPTKLTSHTSKGKWKPFIDN